MNSVDHTFIPTLVEVNSLGIGFTNISNLYKLDLTDDEYLVVGERNNPTNDPLDAKYNLIVNSDGISVNTSRRIYNTVNSNLGQSAGLYVDNNIVTNGNIIAKGLILNDIKIAGDINSNVLDSFVKQINDKIQPLERGFNASILNNNGVPTNIDNVYSTSYITLGGFTDTFSNSHPLNIVETANNTIENIHISLKNDNNNNEDDSQFRLGIIGGGIESPAILSTTEGMPLEFHVSIKSVDMNHLYESGNTEPQYSSSNNLLNLPAMCIDKRRNVSIGSNMTQEITYNKMSIYNQNPQREIITEYAKLQVEGTGVIRDIITYDYYTKNYLH